MMASPDEELERLVSLRRYEILDTEPEPAFDDIGRLAAYLCNSPIAMISLVDGDRLWFKARHGMGIEETHREGSFCSRAILGDGVFMVPDAGADGRFEAHPLVAGEPGVRFYAGAPLVDAGGHRLGTLCVMDLTPRELDPRQVEMLETLGRQVVALLAPRVARITEEEVGASRVREADRKRLAAVFGAEGRVVGASEAARDITGRVLAGQDSRRSESETRRLALVASRTDHAVIIVNAKGEIEWVNDGFTMITGFAPDEAVGRRPSTLLTGPASDWEAIRSMQEQLAAGLAFKGEGLQYTKSGRVIWVTSEMQPIRDEAGTLTHYVLIQTDITHSKNAEAELRHARDELEVRVRERTAELAAQADSLRRAEEAYRSIFENALDGIFQTTPAGHYLRANPALARIYGYASPEELAEHLGENGRLFYLEPGRRETLLTLLDDLGFVTGFESQVRRKDGQVIWISENVRVVRDDSGGVAYYEGIVVDVTERRRAEAEIQSLNRELEIAYDATIEGWAKALDLRDKETEGHTRRVTEMSLRLARALGIGGQDLVHIRRGALLHDIGKLGVPDAVLLKAGELTEDEWAIMRRHPSNARDWLESIPVLRQALEIPYSHHEKWDGTGYPEGLAGEAIPLAARLFAAVDIWDALRSDRPYRAAWTDERVRSHLRSLAGTHLDPAVVAVFLRVLEDSSARIEAPATSARPETPEVAAKIPARRPEGRPRGTPQAESPPLARKRGLAGQLELWRRNSRLAELVNTDSLTGLRNRRYFHQVLQSSFNTCMGEGRPLTLILFDLDGFKAYNDRHGHSAGDEVLRELANLLRHQIRPDDVVARYGGEEFAALLHWGDARDGLGWVETLRARMQEHRWPRTPVTASFGLSTLTPDTHTSTMLIEQADHAMFAAKRLGRDRVVRHEDFSISRIESFW